MLNTDKAIIDFIDDYCIGTNVECYGVIDYEKENFIGLEIDLFDYLDKITDFEEDIEVLLAELDEKLEENWIISHEYSEETSVSDLDGIEYPDYHCYIKIYKGEE